MSFCQNHPQHHILFICLQKTCSQQRLSCILCADQYHHKHEFISISCFYSMMESKLQINRTNPEKQLIIKQLNKSKADLLQRLQNVKNKLIGLVGQCEEKVEQYYSKIYHSFAIDSHQILIKYLQQNFTSQRISEFISKMDEFENITLGNLSETSSILYSNLAILKQKIAQSFTACQTQLQSIASSFSQFSLAKPNTFQYRFSRQRKSMLIGVSDCQERIMRINGSGGYPMCLVETPFSPINRAVLFCIDKIEGNKKSICLGVCLQNVVKGLNYSNCAGFNKGIYAIDQNNPYNSEQSMLASWNHHDSTFNQTNVGTVGLVGWTFCEGDKIRVEIDYYNSIVTFVKGQEAQWQQVQQIQVYEMPIKLNSGPIHAFVSCQNKGDRVSIRRC